MKPLFPLIAFLSVIILSAANPDLPVVRAVPAVVDTLPPLDSADKMKVYELVFSDSTGFYLRVQGDKLTIKNNDTGYALRLVLREYYKMQAQRDSAFGRPKQQ